MAQAIIRAHREGATVLGICGGYQMMGVEVLDPDHVEGSIERLPGLGLLPISTSMTGEKVTRQDTFRLAVTGVDTGIMQGYEIHMGETKPVQEAAPSPLNTFTDGHPDGYFVDAKCMGTYIHGILDNPVFIDFLLRPWQEKMDKASETFDYQAFKEEQYNKLATHIRQHVDMDKVYQILTSHD